MKKRKVNMKELMKGKNKGYFRSRGYSTIKHTFIDEKGKQVEELLEFEIQPLGGHPLLKEYVKNNPEPKPPVKRELINTDTGKSVTEEGVSVKEVKNNPKFKWANVFDYNDEGFIEERDEYYKRIRLLQMMLVFELEDEFGVDKSDDFEQRLEDLGFTSNQLNKIGEDIKNLDFFTENNE
jgi:hypothetical protein